MSSPEKPQSVRRIEHALAVDFQFGQVQDCARGRDLLQLLTDKLGPELLFEIGHGLRRTDGRTLGRGFLFLCGTFTKEYNVRREDNYTGTGKRGWRGSVVVRVRSERFLFGKLKTDRNR